jgi:hypothetical protein
MDVFVPGRADYRRLAVVFVLVVATTASLALAPRGDKGESLPLRMERGRLVQTMVAGLEKRVAGRRASKDEIERVAREIAPIVEAASRQPWARARWNGSRAITA